MNFKSAALATLLLALTGAAFGGEQPYPLRPVRVIVPFAPGGPTDVVARLIAQKLSQAFGQNVVVDNRAGAGGNIGMGIAAKAPGDGYTMLIVSSSYIANPSLYAKVPYDPYRDFVAVTNASASPNVLAVHPTVAARSLKEFIALAKANPGKYSYASPGTGTTAQLTGELFKIMAGINLLHVPYNGAGPAMTAILANQVPTIFVALPPTTAHVKSGALRALGVSSLKRSSAMPEVPTIDESGFPGFESDVMQGVFVPAGTPRVIVDRLYREIARAISMPDMKERLAALGFEPIANTPEQFAVYLKNEIPKWAKVIRQAGIEVN